jgi:hypothetical protein
MEKAKNLLQYLFDIVNRQGIVRRFTLGTTIYMTYTATTWAQHYAETSQKSGLEIAAIIGAVTAPLMALQGAAFKHYLSSRQEDERH